MAATQLASALVMGALVAIVVAAVVRGRRWRQYAPRPDENVEARPLPGGAAEDPVGLWVAAFVVAALGAMAGAVALVSTPDLGLTSGPVLIGAAGIVSLYLLSGVYFLARERGHPNSLAVAETATVVGALFLAAVAAQLIGA
ncbi:hypothetical protein [Halomicrobium urmianum]|uniref:hypothetical protein n=1 Tax=Halomicrobium urmianum TaxID=1586233 RepID=UPI001CD94C9E|nr:hypothetical protein [Halomicrobium urmianum]